MKWKYNLTNKQLKHLKEQNIFTLDAFIRTREAQIEMMKLTKKFGLSRISEPCWDCREIAKRLDVCQERNEI